jgi:hypothetical protein
MQQLAKEVKGGADALVSDEGVSVDGENPST